MITTTRNEDGTTSIVCEVSGREWVADAIHRKETVELAEKWQRDTIAKLDVDATKPLPLETYREAYRLYQQYKRGK